MTDLADLADRTRRWIDGDPDPATRSELTDLLEREKWDELGERMNGELEFGTAGIRGAVEAGSNRMNRAVVIRTTAGLAEFLTKHREGPVIVGFDGRTSSPQFGQDTVGVLVAAGHEVRYFDEPVPTPIVAFAAKVEGAAAAVVITASHNPPADNGYKVYDSNAAQIIPPVDAQIASAIAGIGPANSVARADDAMSGESDRAHRLDIEQIYTRYRSQVESVRRLPSRRESLSIAYTPMHGVGWRIVSRLMEESGYGDVTPVRSQRDPDGRFPTVSFPNPEEPGAMDAVMSLGTAIDADLVVANDPDVDRLAVALPRSEGGWTMLTGNQVGVLMADWLLEGWKDEERPLVINSIVSSPMLGAVADLWGARFEQTLTGFKWIANAAMDLEAAGEGRFVFGYEEALGYSVGPVVRDKDGMSAAVVFADMAAEQKAQGSTVAERLKDLYRRVGLWASAQASVVRPGIEGGAEIEAAMERLASSPPETVSGRNVAAVVDYGKGAEEQSPWLPSTSLVALHLEGGGRVLVRPSGTEPKLKVYVDLPGDSSDEPVDDEQRVARAADGLAQGLVDWLGFSD